MHKKARITLTIKPDDKVRVKTGDEVYPGDLIISSGTHNFEEFNLATALQISPKLFEKFLEIKDGEEVKRGMPLARKKGLLQTIVVRSPLDGVFMVKDRDTGVVAVTSKKDVKDITCWFWGKVAELVDDKIIFELNGTAFSGKEGKGKPVSGTLVYIPKEITVLDMPTDISEKVLVVRSALADVIAKADALGVSAIVAQNVEQPPFNLPYVLLDTIDLLEKFHEKSSIVYGDEKQILIVEEKHNTNPSAN